MNKKTGVIYQIPCGTCNEIYIGQAEVIFSTIIIALMMVTEE